MGTQVAFKITLSAIILALHAVTPALAADSHADQTHTSEADASVYVLFGDGCDEDYAAELRDAGLTVEVRKLQSLKAVAAFVEIPSDVDLQHLTIIRGYVVANHVAPTALLKMIESKPKTRGLVGDSACANAYNHQRLHAAQPRMF